MTKKSKKPDPIFLSANQVGHLIDGAVKNLLDLKIHEDDYGYKFLILCDCVVPETCMSVDQAPETDEDYYDIMLAHSISELRDFFEAILTVKHEDGKLYRGFSTGYIDQDNVAAFVDSLTELEEFWNDIDQGIANDEETKDVTKGKNLVSGNGTVQ